MYGDKEENLRKETNPKKLRKIKREMQFWFSIFDTCTILISKVSTKINPVPNVW